MLVQAKVKKLDYLHDDRKAIVRENARPELGASVCFAFFAGQRMSYMKASHCGSDRPEIGREECDGGEPALSMEDQHKYTGLNTAIQTQAFFNRSGTRYVSPAWWIEAMGNLNSLES